MSESLFGADYYGKNDQRGLPYHRGYHALDLPYMTKAGEGQQVPQSMRYNGPGGHTLGSCRDTLLADQVRIFHEPKYSQQYFDKYKGTMCIDFHLTTGIEFKDKERHLKALQGFCGILKEQALSYFNCKFDFKVEPLPKSVLDQYGVRGGFLIVCQLPAELFGNHAAIQLIVMWVRSALRECLPKENFLEGPHYSMDTNKWAGDYQRINDTLGSNKKWFEFLKAVKPIMRMSFGPDLLAFIDKYISEDERKALIKIHGTPSWEQSPYQYSLMKGLQTISLAETWMNLKDLKPNNTIQTIQFAHILAVHMLTSIGVVPKLNFRSTESGGPYRGWIYTHEGFDAAWPPSVKPAPVAVPKVRIDPVTTSPSTPTGTRSATRAGTTGQRSTRLGL